jgi:hypothetical protein
MIGDPTSPAGRAFSQRFVVWGLASRLTTGSNSRRPRTTRPSIGRLVPATPWLLLVVPKPSESAGVTCGPNRYASPCLTHVAPGERTTRKTEHGRPLCRIAPKERQLGPLTDMPPIPGRHFREYKSEDVGVAGKLMRKYIDGRLTRSTHLRRYMDKSTGTGVLQHPKRTVRGFFHIAQPMPHIPALSGLGAAMAVEDDAVE